MTNENTPHPPKHSPNEHPTDQITETDLIRLVNSLEDLLVEGAGRPRGMLMRQSDILDAIFNAIMAAHLKDAVCAQFTGDTDPNAMAGWLSMALQTQKQCTEALKAASTIEYLDAMTGRLNTPLPPGDDKRTDKGA